MDDDPDRDQGPIAAMRRWLRGAPAGSARDASATSDFSGLPNHSPESEAASIDPEQQEAGSVQAAHAPDPVAEPLREPLPRFSAHALWAPKLGDDEAEWEDAFAYDERLGLAAVADGASEGIFSRAWSSLLCNSLVTEPVNLADGEAVAGRLARLRASWLRDIDYPSRRYTQQAKVDQIGAAATLLLLQVDATPDEPAGEVSGREGLRWRAWAIGDSCLFHVRDGQLLTTFPIESVTDFGLAPPLVRTRAGIATPAPMESLGDCRHGDLFLLATDAVAQSLLHQVESGVPPDWERFGRLDLPTWRSEIDAARNVRRIVNDDSTLLCLRVTSTPPLRGLDDECEPELSN